MEINTQAIWTDESRNSNRPSIRGHRLTIGHFLASLTEMTIEEYAEDFDIELELCEQVLVDLNNIINENK